MIQHFDKLNILAHVHMFPPVHNAGSETTLLSILRGMVRRGHKAKVLATEIERDYTIDGVEVLACPQPAQSHEQEWLHKHYEQCDVAITHLNCTGSAMRQARDASKPLVHLVHNHRQLKFHNVRPIRAQLLIFNTAWVRETNLTDDCPVVNPSMVVHPIIEPEQYRTTPGNRTLFVNLTVTKGAEVFYELARRSPKIFFVGLRGAYGDQFIPEEHFNNVFIYEHTADMKAVFGVTKVVLMPSDYESYGRVAVEAACSGIPSIVHPTPGLSEALGSAGIYCHRSKVDDWHKELTRLYTDNDYYKERSAAALELANSLTPERSLDRVEAALRIVAKVGLKGIDSQTMEVLGEAEYLRRAKEGGYFDPAMEPRSYRPALGGGSMRQVPYTANRKLFLNAAGNVVDETSTDRVVILVGPGGQVPYARAVDLKWATGEPLLEPTPSHEMSPAEQEEKALDPGEDKSFKAPESKKSKKGGRRTA